MPACMDCENSLATESDGLCDACRLGLKLAISKIREGCAKRKQEQADNEDASDG